MEFNSFFLHKQDVFHETHLKFYISGTKPFLFVLKFILFPVYFHFRQSRMLILKTFPATGKVDWIISFKNTQTLPTV